MNCWLACPFVRPVACTASLAGSTGPAVIAAARVLALAVMASAFVGSLHAQTVVDVFSGGSLPGDVAIDEVGRRLFVPNYNGHSVTVLDADTHETTAVIPTGSWGFSRPVGLEYNAVTNRLYVVHQSTPGHLLVINAADYKFIHALQTPGMMRDVDIDPSTNHIYVTANESDQAGLLLKIDGATHTVTRAAIPPNPSGVRVNKQTGRVFAVAGKFLSAVDSLTMSVVGNVAIRASTTYHTESYPAVNERTNRVYVTDDVANVLFMLDGASLAVLKTVSGFPDTRGLTAAAVNTRTNRVFAASFYHPAASVTILDGSTLERVSVVPTCCGNYRITMHAAADLAYVVNHTSATITTIHDDGPPAAQVPNISWTPAHLTYGEALGSAQLNAVASVNGVAVAGTFEYTPGTATLLPGGEHAAKVLFRPYDSSQYEVASGTATITVLRALPTLTLANVTTTYDGMPHGTIGSASGVDGESLGPLSVLYDGSSGAPVSAGVYVAVGAFAGNGNYLPASVEASVVIERAVPVLSWLPASPLIIGAPLAQHQLNASASVPGTFTYAPASGAVLPVGDHTLKVGFHPNDSLNYSGVEAAAPVTVKYGVCLLYDAARVAKIGSTIPLKLALCDAAGVNVSSAETGVRATRLRLVSTAVSGTVQDAGNANPDADFRYDLDLVGYIFNLQTGGLTQGHWQVLFTVAGKDTEYTAPFQLK